jgi:hypothetical protein
LGKKSTYIAVRRVLHTYVKIIKKIV